MKILNINKNNRLAFFYLTLITLNSLAYSINSHSTDDASINKKNIEDFIENIETKIQNKSNLRKSKSKKYLKMKSGDINLSNKQDIFEEQIQLIENISKNQNKSDSFMYASWFIFVPLVLLIFIMTILSIAGFLILILNSTNSSSLNEKKPFHSNHYNRLNGNIDYSNQDIIEILRQKRNKRKKKTNSNFKPEPEPEAILLTM